MIALKYVPSKLQLADFFTKAQTREQHQLNMLKLNALDPPFHLEFEGRVLNSISMIGLERYGTPWPWVPTDQGLSCPRQVGLTCQKTSRPISSLI
jgi:hypothetical protein